MLKVLVNAYAISPDRGSEPGMGWNWCKGLAQECELFIITESEFRSEIEKGLPSLPQAANMHFYYLPVSERVREMCRNQGDWRFYYYYALWQRRALKLARKICSEQQMDVIHQLNMVGFREPGLLWKIKGPKYIWGPVSGMSMTPIRFFADAPAREKMAIRLKNAITWLQRSLSCKVNKAIRRASAVICVTKEDFEIVSRRAGGGRRVVLINETATDSTIDRVERDDNHPTRLVWVGKFMQRKQLGLALKSMALLKDLPVKLDIVGTGSEEEVLQYHKLAKDLGIEHMVSWHGQIPHEEVGPMMDRADIFLFTSVHEATSTVIMEAITHGLPIICFDSCGFGPLVTEDMGIKIPLSNPETSIRNFAAAIRRLCCNPSLRKQASEACYAKAGDLSWKGKIPKVLSLYSK